VEFKILGSPQVVVDGRPLGVGGPRTTAVLAMLAVNAGKIVAADVLQEELWPGLPARRAAANLQVRVSELRSALRAAGQDQRLVTRPPGYVLRAEPEEVDASCFAALLARGREALASGDAHRAADHLRAASALWRGPALSGLADVPFARAEAARLEQARLEAVELRVEAELACGGGPELVAELEALTAEHPLRERLWAQRMLALYRAGRQADALRCYQDLREALTGELGIDPGREARELETLILRQDPSLDPPPPARGQPRRRALGGPGREVPETRYAVNGELRIAYQVVGAGEPDIVFVPGLISHLDLWWDEPITARFFGRLASLGRVILFDKRDTGLSDRGPGDAPLEERMTDLEAVMDACGSRRAVLFGYSEGAPMSLLFAATHPQRVTALILGAGAARWKAAADYPCGRGSAAMFAAIEQLARHEWGTGASIEWYHPGAAGSARARQQMARWERMAVSPGALLSMSRMCYAVDVRSVLPAIHAPALIIQRLDDRITPPCHGRYLAAHLPAARYFEQPGSHLLWAGDTDSLFAQIEDLLTGGGHQPRSDRMLCALVAANTAHPGSGELPGSPRTARQDACAAAARDAIRAHGGRLLRHSDASVLAAFDGPARAIRCASVLRDQVTGLGIKLRLGIHCGEVDITGDSVGGITVDIATRLASLARPGEMLTSRTVKDLVAGSGIAFTDRGTHHLPEIPDQWPVFAIGEGDTG
jgi:DNA-binding SARP family transcriptional activator/pimeloyl-ACP methyl ester carboxylesterase/class 3 adenylate cyclase